MKLHHAFIVVAAVGGLVVALRASPPDGKIRYINLQAPALDPVVCCGESYNDLVPDTLDIAERAELAVNGLTGPLDPAYDDELYFQARLIHNPPVMLHDWFDWYGLKFCESLSLLRSVTGSTLNRDVDSVWLQVLLKSTGPDGLLYLPMEGRPWAKVNWVFGPMVWRGDGTTTTIEDPAVTQVTHPIAIGRAMSAMIVLYLQTGNPLWRKAIERMVDRSLQLLVDKGDYGYFTPGYFEPDARVNPSAPPWLGMAGMDTSTRLIQAPAQFYRATGYEPAKRLALKLINFVRFQCRSFDAEGRFVGREIATGELENGGEHFHAHTFALLGMIDYAEATGDKDVAAFVEKSYAWARTQGSATVGFFPEWLKPDYPTSETCEVAEMIALALKLSRGGVADHWDDADHWIRNQFAENQLTRVDWLEAATAKLPRQPFTLKDILYDPRRWKGSWTMPEAVCEERVAERALGSFAGWPSANDWISKAIHSDGKTMHCCTANATRTLYYIYENMLEERDGHLQLNLLLNRAAATADVYSYIPDEGKVVLKIKQSLKQVQVRMPEWIATGSPEVQCTIGGQPRPFIWQGRYIDLGAAKPGDYVSVAFPIAERTVKERIGAVDCTLVIKGNTVVAIDPPGKICPLYQRDQERKGELHWRPVRRFVSDKLIDY